MQIFFFVEIETKTGKKSTLKLYIYYVFIIIAAAAAAAAAAVVVQTDAGAYWASSREYQGSFQGVKRPGRGVNHPSYLAPKLEQSRAILTHPFMPSWFVTGTLLLLLLLLLLLQFEVELELLLLVVYV